MPSAFSRVVFADDGPGRRVQGESLRSVERHLELVDRIVVDIQDCDHVTHWPRGSLGQEVDVVAGVERAPISVPMWGSLVRSPQPAERVKRWFQGWS